MTLRPDVISPERLAGFGSADTFRIAVAGSQLTQFFCAIAIEIHSRRARTRRKTKLYRVERHAGQASVPGAQICGRDGTLAEVARSFDRSVPCILA